MGRGGVFQAGAVEGVGADLAFVAGSRDFLAVEKEADGGGVAGADDDFAAGADGGVRGCDQGFSEERLAVGNDGDPRGFGGADEQSERGRRIRDGSVGRGLGWGRIIAR